MAAGKSRKPAHVSACANMAKKAAHDLLLAGKGASNAGETDDERDR